MITAVANLYFIIPLAIAPIILTFFTAKGSLVNKRYGKPFRRLTGKGWLVLFINICIITILILQEQNSQIKNDINDSKQDSIKYTGEANIAITKKIDRFDTSLEKLQRLNNAVDSNTQRLVEETKNITTNNLSLTTKTKKLTENVEGLTSKVNDLLQKLHNEITGAKSIPIVHANLSYNFKMPSHGHYEMVRPTFDNQWIIDFTIQNYGEYPIKEIKTSRKFSRSYGSTKEADIPTITYLRSGDSQPLLPTILVNHPDGQYYYIIFIKWNLEYTYRVEVQAVPTFELVNGSHIVYTMKESYYYKKILYKSSRDLKEAIQNDMK